MATTVVVRVATSAIAVAWGLLPEGGADAAQTQDAAKGRSGDGFEGLTTGSRSCQGFGQLIKAGRVHLPSVLSRGRCPQV
jgi:hypothetical protein